MEYLKYHFIYCTSAAETARRTNGVYVAGVVKESKVILWFKCFRFGNFDLHNKPLERMEIKLENEKLKGILEADPS